MTKSAHDMLMRQIAKFSHRSEYPSAYSSQTGIAWFMGEISKDDIAVSCDGRLILNLRVVGQSESFRREDVL